MTTFFIEHQCPQCGAPVTLEESDRLVRCPYCRVESYLIQHPYFRYVLPQNAPENTQLIYVPYWRFKGILFSSVPGGVKHRFMDVSIQGVHSKYFPVSLGFRSQALRLKFALPEIGGRFLQPTFPLEKAMGVFAQRFNKNLPGPIYHEDFIGETLSIIYSPFYVKNQVIDAVINRRVSERMADDFDVESFPQDSRAWQLLFVPTLCPHCGRNLTGERDSLVLLCKNCDSVWFAKEKKLKRIKFGSFKMSGDIYLPFWRIKASVEGIALNSYADLINLANLPRVPQQQDYKTDFFFWSPAFKMPPKVFLRLNQILTLTQPQNGQINKIPQKHIHPVTLPVTEAAESMKISLASFVRPSNRYLPYLSKIRIQPEKARLIFIPFHKGHHELIQEKFALTINKNQLKLSSNL